jgi:hypothetical protein
MDAQKTGTDLLFRATRSTGTDLLSRLRGMEADFQFFSPQNSRKPLILPGAIPESACSADLPYCATSAISGGILSCFLRCKKRHKDGKEFKGDLAIRPVYHQLEKRIEAHIFISFLSCCLQVTLKSRLKRCASGL